MGYFTKMDTNIWPVITSGKGVQSEAKKRELKKNLYSHSNKSVDRIIEYFIESNSFDK
jgi:hypothetical protein